MRTRRRRRLVLGAILVVLGGWFYLMELGYLREFSGELVLAAIGSLFLISYISHDHYGYLVPGGILLGLAAGQALEAQLEPLGDGPLIGLATGFLLIYVAPLLRGRRSQWWPVIPAAILYLFAVDALRDLADLVADHWQLILVLVGLILMAMALLADDSKPPRRLRRRRRPGPPDPPVPPPDPGAR